MPRRTSRYTLACARCGESFTVEEHRRDTARYCSRVCHNLAQSHREDRTCPQCHQIFVAKPGEFRRGRAIYCSTACYGAAKRTRVTIACAHCGKSFERQPSQVGEFCSHRCFNESRKTTYTCARCGKVFRRDASDAPARFCSRTCKETETAEETAARFWSKVDKSGECWLWTASTIHSGYGRFTASGAAISAHRWSYEAAYGPLPADVLVQHSCDTPACVNPAHLFPGTPATNKHDEVIKGRNVRGSRCHTAKLTEDQVRAIRRRHALEGVSQAQLGREYGVRDRLIGRVIRRESWAHLP